MFVLFRAVTYATLFVGLVLIYVPARLFGRADSAVPPGAELAERDPAPVGILTGGGHRNPGGDRRDPGSPVASDQLVSFVGGWLKWRGQQLASALTADVHAHDFGGGVANAAGASVLRFASFSARTRSSSARKSVRGRRVLKYGSRSANQTSHQP